MPEQLQQFKHYFSLEMDQFLHRCGDEVRHNWNWQDYLDHLHNKPSLFIACTSFFFLNCLERINISRKWNDTIVSIPFLGAVTYCEQIYRDSTDFTSFAVLLDDQQLAYHLGQVLMKNGAIVYSKSQVERYMARGHVLEVDAEIADSDSALEETGS